MRFRTINTRYEWGGMVVMKAVDTGFNVWNEPFGHFLLHPVDIAEQPNLVAIFEVSTW